MIFFKGTDLCLAGHRIRLAPEDLGFDEINEKPEVVNITEQKEERHTNVHPVFREILEEISNVKS